MLTTILLALILGITLGLLLATFLLLYSIKIKCPQCKNLKSVQEITAFNWKDRIDKNGEAYWKFKEAGESEIIKTNDPTPNSNSAEAVDKFTQRQIKHEARTNNSQQSESVSS